MNFSINESEVVINKPEVDIATIQYEYLGSTFELQTSISKVIDYCNRFLEELITEGEKSNYKIVSEKKDVTPYIDMVSKEEIFTMHKGKGEKWLMKAKAKQFDSWKVVHLLNTNTIFMMNKELHLIYVFNDSIDFLMEDTFHAIRSLLPRVGENNNYSIFHSAGLIFKGKGVMVVGESGKGKTTTFLDLLKSGGTPLSNDRVMINSNFKDHLVMDTWPSFINTSIGTINKFPELHHLYDTSEIHDLHELWNSKKKIPIEPSDFKRLFNKEFTISHKIDLILFPELSPKTIKSSLESISKNDMKNLLLESCYSPDDPAYFNWHNMIDLMRDDLKENSSKIINTLLESVPAYKLCGGVDLTSAISKLSEICENDDAR